MDSWGEDELDLDDYYASLGLEYTHDCDDNSDFYDSDEDDPELMARLAELEASYLAAAASREEQRRLRKNNSSSSDWFPEFPIANEAVDDEFPYLAAKTSADFEKEIGDPIDEDDDYHVDHLFFPTYGPVGDLLPDSDDELIDSDDDVSYCEFDDETLDFHLSRFESKYSSFLESPAFSYRALSGPFLCEIRSRRIYPPLNYLTARISHGQRSSWKLRSHSHNYYYDDFPAFALKRSSFSLWKRLSLQVPTVLDFIGRFHHLVAFFPHLRRQVSHKARDVTNYYLIYFIQYLMSSFLLAHAILPIFTVLSAISSSSRFLVGPVSCRAAPTFSSTAKTIGELNSPPWILGLR